MIQITSALIVLVGFATSFVLVLILNRVHNLPRPNVWTGSAIANYSTPQISLTNDNVEGRNNSFHQRGHVRLEPVGDSAGLRVNQTATVADKRANSSIPDLGPRVCNGITVTSTVHNHILCSAFCAISRVDDIVHFSGHRIAQVFDTGNKKLHVYIGNEMKARYWGEVAELVTEVWKRTGGHYANATNATLPSVSATHTGDVGVHVHNYHKLGDFLLLFREEFFRTHPDRKKFAAAGPKAVPLTRAQIQWAADRGQPPVVVTNWGDENWGFLSGQVNTRTTRWLNLTNHLRIHFSDFSTVHKLLDSPKIVLVVTNTHVDPQIGNHSKIICVPLGLRGRDSLFGKMRKMVTLSYNKTTLLRINNSGWGERVLINALVSAAFNNTVRNSYDLRSKADHHLETAKAKFVLCPSGLGFDTYRLWETILAGSIPVVESNTGLDRTYSNLPVLVVRNYSDLTPALLDRAYPCFQRNSHRYNYHHLTERYWVDLVQTAVRTGSNAHVTEQHPFRNKYCDFL